MVKTVKNIFINNLLFLPNIYKKLCYNIYVLQTYRVA
jgi:hypothetical protein